MQENFAKLSYFTSKMILTAWLSGIVSKEVQIVYRVFLVSCYLLHTFWIMSSQLATWEVEWLIKLA